MNLRLSILLVTVLLIFGGTVLVIWLTGSEEARPQSPWLYSIDENSIAHITITHQGKTVDYYRKPGTLDWYIQGDPEVRVFQGLWGGKVLLFGGPKVNREVTTELKDPANFGLMPPQTRVMVTDSWGNTIEFHLGDPTPDTKEQYVRLAGDSGLFTVTIDWAEVVNRLVTEPPYLRLFQLEEDAIVFIRVNSGDETAIFTKNQTSGQWSIQGPTPVPVFEDKWGDAVKAISGPRVDRLVSEAHRRTGAVRAGRASHYGYHRYIRQETYGVPPWGRHPGRQTPIRPGSWRTGTVCYAEGSGRTHF